MSTDTVRAPAEQFAVEQLGWAADDAAIPLLEAFAGAQRQAGRAEALREALGLDTPWPVTDILTKLADAADHLLREHGCDAHGWEGVHAARDAARQRLAALRAAGQE